MIETEAWVAIAFVIFLGILGYFGAHRRVIDALDQRQARIKAELDEARRLRDEAQALLADYQRKQREAGREAEAIIAGATAEAERMAVEAKTRMEDFVTRRTKMAEAKIAQAETQALADVARRGRRRRCRRRRQDPRRDRERQRRRRAAREGHRRRQEEIQLTLASRARPLWAALRSHRPQRPPLNPQPTVVFVHKSALRRERSFFTTFQPYPDAADSSVGSRVSF